MAETASYCSRKTVLLCFAILAIHRATAREFTVGGKAGWVSPASGSVAYNDWAESNRFLIGDTLVFKYNPSEDSVAEVSAEDYNSCSTSNPKSSYNDGNTAFTFLRHGPFYFITANSTNCQKGQKLIVVVLAPRNARPSPSPSPAPLPASTVPSPAPTAAFSPSADPAPAPAPTVASPAPAAPVPTAVLSPSPAPTATVETPAPASVSVPLVSPVAAPGNFTSPTSAPIESQGGSGGVRSASAPAATASGFVYAAAIIATLVFS